MLGDVMMELMIDNSFMLNEWDYKHLDRGRYFNCFLKGLKGDAGTKGALGRFGARGPVGQKVSTASF